MPANLDASRFVAWLAPKVRLFAKLTGTELITIGDDTTEADLLKLGEC